MNTFDDSFEDVSLTVGGRKRRSNKANHGKEIAKRQRHSSGGKIPQIACTHSADKGCCWAEYLTGPSLALNQEKFYASTNKVEQDAYLLRFMTVASAKRLQTKDEDRKKSRNTITTFYLLSAQGQGKLRVCKEIFCSVLGISKDRATRVAKYFADNQEPRPENRGGRRKVDSDLLKRDAVIAHIQTFKCKASHYSRKDCPGRKYLPHELSIAKLYKMFCDPNAEQVSLSYSFYYSVFL